MIASSRPRLTYEEYCQIEVDSPIRHEYHDGQVWAMAGGSREHAAIAANIVGLLAVALRGSARQVHTSDLRIRVRATGLATYPDVSVVCGRAEYDRSEKLSHYQRIDSLREIVLVAPAEHGIDVWRRGADGSWAMSTYRSGGVELSSIGATLPVAEVYRDPLSSRA